MPSDCSGRELVSDVAVMSTEEYLAFRLKEWMVLKALEDIVEAHERAEPMAELIADARSLLDMRFLEERQV